MATARLIAAGVGTILLAGCGGGSEVPAPVATESPAAAARPPSAAADPAPNAPASPPFVDRTDGSGLSFVHDPSPTDERSYPEILGSGGAVIDHDGDGDLDVYLVQGGRIPGTEIGTPAPNRLFRNDGAGRFTDVTGTIGDAADERFGMGAIVIDLEGDGDQDLFVTNVGRDTLLVNDGTGRFTDVTEAAGLVGDGYSLGAAFLDIEGDGDLDLYVADYTRWVPGIDPECFTDRGVRDYCGPANYEGAPDRLYRNRGDGTFEDISVSSGIAAVATRSMGLGVADFDGDGLEDVFVANDGEPNLLWRNLGDGTFSEEAAILGCAVNADGLAEASMGVAVADIDDDGDFDLLCTHLVGETHTVYRNEGRWFEDVTRASGLAVWTRPDTGFGVDWADLDFDGDEDLVVANGAVMIPLAAEDPVHPYAEGDRLALGDGARWPEGVTLPSAAGRDQVGRGIVTADLDGDGRLDLLFTNNRGPAQWLRNELPEAGAWIGLQLRADGPNRDAVGAVVTVQAGDRTEHRVVRSHRGYLTAHDPVQRVGLGPLPEATPIGVRVRWPGGGIETFAGLEPGKVHLIERGGGRADAAEESAP